MPADALQEKQEVIEAVGHRLVDRLTEADREPLG